MHRLHKTLFWTIGILWSCFGFVWELPDARLLIVEEAFDELPEEGVTYRVEYLKNTEIVVKFEKIE